MNKSFGKEQVQATAAQLFAQLPADQSAHLIGVTPKGQADFISDFGINNYTAALKPYFEGEFAMLHLEGKPTGKIAEILEVVLGEDEALVRFELDGANLRLTAHEFAKKFSVIGGLSRAESGETNRKLLKFIDAFTRAHYLGAWLKELEDSGSVEGCGECDACVQARGESVEALGESGVVPEQPKDVVLEALLGAGAVVEGGQVSGDGARTSQADVEAKLQKVLSEIPPHLRELALAIAKHAQGSVK